MDTKLPPKTSPSLLDYGPTIYVGLHRSLDPPDPSHPKLRLDPASRCGRETKLTGVCVSSSLPRCGVLELVCVRAVFTTLYGLSLSLSLSLELTMPPVIDAAAAARDHAVVNRDYIVVSLR